MIEKTSFFSLSFEELKNVLKQETLNISAAFLLYNWYYKKAKIGICQLPVARKTLSFLDENYSFELPKIVEVYRSEDKTVKFLFELKDGLNVETVLIPFQGKYTLCLSTQVGCAMRCSFCFTGTQGLTRNLNTEEIIGQYLEVYRWLGVERPLEQRILNLVFMGQGEPLHNFDQVKKACQIFIAQQGTSLAVEKITVSTSGYLPGLKRWVEEMPKVNLALSLHSPIPEKRDRLIPLNKRFPVTEVLETIDSIPIDSRRFMTFEMMLIKGFNDSLEDAHETGRVLKNRRGLINLIPFNPFPGSEFERPENDTLDKFKEILEGYKIPTLIRKTKGDDILAACGQLKTMIQGG